MPTNLDVQHCIQSYLNEASGQTSADIVAAAWESVNDYRLANCGYGQQIVAAEHYLWMRKVSGSEPYIYLLVVPFFTAGIPAYDIYKMICKKLDLQAYQESSCPPSDPSPWVRAWSYTGLCDGSRDSGTTNTRPVAPAQPNWFGRGMTYPYNEPGAN